MAAAELDVDLTIADPAGEGTRATNSRGAKNPEGGIPPFSRFGEQTVNTKVYVNGLDLFTLSTFVNQSTIDGGRGYFPIVGTVWRGIFGDIPFLGSFFSWKKPPQTAYHDSIILTSAIISPTAMGIAVLYPNVSLRDTPEDFARKCLDVGTYKEENRLETTNSLEPSLIYTANPVMRRCDNLFNPKKEQ
jgi:hypothetical protein